MASKQKKIGVFISYSHQDLKLIEPIVRLISTLRNDLVFQDIKNLQSGKKWEPQLMTALAEAKLFIVFWCHHSADSLYVQKEVAYAVNNGKDVLPLKLDATQITGDLSEYQWIDLSTTNIHPNDLVFEDVTELPQSSDPQWPDMQGARPW